MYQNDKKVVSCFYNAPQPGGNQSLRAQDVKASQFLSQFPWCRVATAFMLQDLNRQRTVEGTVCVAPTAAQKMMDRHSYAVLAALQHKSANPSSNHLRSCPWWHLAMTAMHTFCLFAVKVHGDIFAGLAARKEDKCDDMKNKVILVSRRRSDLSQALPLGRGGGGPGVFTCSLLDWGAGKRHRRNVHDYYVDQAQEAAVAPHAVLTQQRMEGFLRDLPPPLQEHVRAAASAHGFDLVTGAQLGRGQRNRK
jgi:hypothetical protein